MRRKADPRAPLSIPDTWLDGVVSIAKAAGRDFDITPLDLIEQRHLGMLYRCGYQAAHAAQTLYGSRMIQVGPWGDEDERRAQP